MHKRPYLPLNGVHVAQERFNCCWPLPHVIGSPDLGVLSASLTSVRSSGHPAFSARPALQAALEPDGSPLFTSNPSVACWRYEPRKHSSTLAVARTGIPPSPLTDRVGYFDQCDFGAIFPFTDVPAYNLPVYASQWPLPEHHARLGTQLLARLCRGSHFRPLNLMRLQGATATPPGMRVRTGRFE